MKKLKILIIACVAVVGAVFVLVQHAVAMGGRPGPLHECGDIRLKMGDTVFSMPRHKIDFNYMRPEEDRRKVLCLRPSDPPVDVTFFSFMPAGNFPALKPDATGHVPTSPMQFQVAYVPNDDIEDPYKMVEKALQASNVKLTDLPIQKGFYVWNRPGVDQNFGYKDVYISAKPDIKTSNGYPIVFGCDNFCWTSVWKDDIRFGVRLIDPRLITPDRWGEFYRLLEQYRQSITIVSKSQEIKP